jgi:hypothetical protein
MVKIDRQEIQRQATRRQPVQQSATADGAATTEKTTRQVEIFETSPGQGIQPQESEAKTKRAPRKSVERVPKRNYRYRQIALLAAQGWTNKLIADELDLNSVTVSAIKKSPAIQNLIAEFQEKMTDKAIQEGVINRLTQDFLPSMDAIAELRDFGEEETTKLSAAKFMAEKAIDVLVPKKTVVEEHKKVGVVVMKADDIETFKAIMDEEDGEGNKILEIEAEDET